MIAGLPYDAEVEYLESTGTQYVRTDIKGADIRTGGVEIDSMCTTYKAGTPNPWPVAVGILPIDNFCMNGIHAREDQLYWRFDSSRRRCWTTSFPNLATFIGARIKSLAKSGTLAVSYNGTSASYMELGFSYDYLCSNNDNFLCFFSYDNCNRPISMRFFSAKVWDNDLKLIGDFIPVRFTNELGQPEGAMYDRVSRKLFRNAGTGAFVIGPDVATPVMGLHFMKSPIKTARDYVQDGLIAMWDGIENAGWGVHDDAATEWVDLVTGFSLPVLSGGTWDSNCIVGDGSAPAAGLTGNIEYLRQPFCECVFEILEYPQRHGLHRAFELKYTATDDYFKNIGVSDSYGRVLFNLNVRVVSSINDFLQATSASLASVARNDNTAYFINAQTATESGGNGQGTFGAGLFVFAKNVVGSPYWADPNKGKLFSLRFYSRALTAAEIAANYAIDKARFNLP